MEKYMTPEMELITMDVEDIIMTSSIPGLDDNETPDYEIPVG